MTSHYDDNYGWYEGMDDPVMQSFARQVAKESVWKVCRQCKNRVKLRPDYDLCNSCAENMERGGA